MPNALSEALEILAQGGARIVAGGTDVYPAAKQGRAPEVYLDVKRIEGLSLVSQSDGGTRLGAAVTWSDVVAAELPAAFDALKAAAREVGSIQIQNAGTVVGNICNASPAADGVPALLALDARVEIESARRGRRDVKLADFITGVRQTDLAPDEMVSGIWIPPQEAASQSAFEKLGSRRYLVISICMTAVNIVLDRDRRIASARIAVGACSAVAQRLTALEQDVVGLAPDRVTVTPAHLAPLSPIDDVRGTSAYRLDAVGEQIRRAIIKAAGT
ncbi:FAD binding domain-containing protein [Shimia sediminis]|uniref:FAD binding domain-containing protein n=1 Tax=Shimia sediminis TaxID=2497945 RepID=UPI000F8EE9FB|nr:FAD binding domain-containing protein [Shimia sediminis]